MRRGGRQRRGRRREQFSASFCLLPWHRRHGSGHTPPHRHNLFHLRPALLLSKRDSWSLRLLVGSPTLPQPPVSGCSVSKHGKRLQQRRACRWRCWRWRGGRWAAGRVKALSWRHVWQQGKEKTSETVRRRRPPTQSRGRPCAGLHWRGCRLCMSRRWVAWTERMPSPTSFLAAVTDRVTVAAEAAARGLSGGHGWGGVATTRPPLTCCRWQMARTPCGTEF